MALSAHISFEDSYVLAIMVEPYRLVFAVDFVLMPEHELYRYPTDDERDCFCKGRIVVENFSSCLWKASGLSPSFDSKGDVDFGSFDKILELHSSWIFSGDWGEINISGGQISVSLESNSQDSF